MHIVASDINYILENKDILRRNFQQGMDFQGREPGWVSKN